MKRYWLTSLLALNILLISTLAYVLYQSDTSESAFYSAQEKNIPLEIDPYLDSISEKNIYHPDRKKLITQENDLHSLTLDAGTISKLDGKPYYQIDRETPIAVMIENHPASRPQHSGLEDASIVYETLVEGGITRFMAIYSSYADIEKIGPIRSARPYFVDWAEEFNAVYVHAGGSDQALEQIYISDNIYDINENETNFWRDNTYYAPHNLFTSTEYLKPKQKKYTEFLPQFTKSYFNYGKSEKNLQQEQKKAEEININFSLNSYKVKYEYRSDSNSYIRYMAEKRHGEITPNNIVVMFTPYYVTDEKGRLNMQTTGNGQAWFFMDGKVQKGLWEKSTVQNKTLFYDTNKNEIQFNPGQTWIEIIDTPKKITYS